MAVSETRNQFPLKACTRCGGAGRYSWNQRDGDRCWGCDGTKYAMASATVDAFWTAYANIINNRKRAASEDLDAGDIIAHNGFWREVTATYMYPDSVNGYSGPTRTPISWVMVIEVDVDGKEEFIHTSTYGQHRRQAGYIALAEPREALVAAAWASLTKKQRAALVNPEMEV